MKALLILNDAPYGSERTYNGLRLAGSLSRQENTQVEVFLIGEAELLEGAHRSSMDELTAWTQEADKVLVF